MGTIIAESNSLQEFFGVFYPLLKHTFYLCVAISILYEAIMIKRPQIIKTSNTVTGMFVIYTVTTIIGFFTANWFIWVILLLLGYLRGKYYDNIKWAVELDRLTCIVLMIFTIVNTYHLHLYF